ncbi:hemerythrin domain-containing protein [Bacillus sp. B-jedd]|uniref:hemerythrin domain-containing protein n=1 Tax=Bacillus sp. B-jedd TaxID=1476857 RepID=UPI0005156BF5|nr:hemerythrin domain-containing protein [Bacillus sp. B-jedd]CEG26615.1 hemerythrin HHE cation binding domain-containing protein [Bacillus sp. B-jedd]
MSGCMSAFGGMGIVELCDGLKQLKEEHPPLLAMLDGLLATVGKIENEENLNDSFAQLTERTVNFIAELGPHSDREEGVLFEMMGNYIGRASGPIAVMEYEHDRAKTLIGTYLARTADKGEVFSNAEMKELAAMIKEAYYTLTEHFAKEENVLFPMAQKMLSDEEKTELYKRIQEI